ncbi:hypothetical protein [Methylobacterium durans]|uniref:hypothetical protein n=1 Tax=Methylobacterium durans TaxID=2202825 RepID=UPI0013A58955|nr:hypothetical protein [Methylobacterium durans]
MKILTQTDDFAVYHFPHDNSRHHIVAFSNAFGGATRQEITAKGFLEKLGVGFSVVEHGDKDHWWTVACIDEAISNLKENLVGREIVTYGFSMGGYGALRFAARLEAKRAVAFAPQDTITPSEAPFETRWAWQAQEIGAVVPPARNFFSRDTEYYVTFDPSDIDLFHIRRMLEFRDRCKTFNVLPFWFAGHAVAASLKGAGVLSYLAKGLLTFDDSSVRLAQDLYRQYRRSSPSAAMIAQAARSLGRKHKQRSLFRIVRSNMDKLKREASAEDLIAVYFALRDNEGMEDALPFVLQVASYEPDNSRFACHAADALLYFGRREEARSALERFVGTSADDGWFKTLWARVSGP